MYLFSKMCKKYKQLTHSQSRHFATETVLADIPLLWMKLCTKIHAHCHVERPFMPCVGTMEQNQIFFLVTTFDEVIQSVWHDGWRLRLRSFPAARMKLDWNLVRPFFAHSYFLSPTCVVCACFVCKAVAFVILGEAYVGALLRRLPSCGFSHYMQTNIHKKPVAGKVKTC